MKNKVRCLNFIDLSCIISAFLFIALCSKSSFLYPLNDWGDTNCYFIIGKGILNGMVPYRDLVEQKGPVIFFVYAVANLISSSSYIGVFVIEVICAYLFLRITLATINLFVDADKYSFFTAPLVAAIVYSSSNFCHGGSAEELLLFEFAYAVYLLFRYIEHKRMPGNVEMLVSGLMAGTIFFTKYNLCIIYLSVIAFMILTAVLRKELGQLLRGALFFVAGCLIVSALIFLYFGLNDSIGIFVERYFYNSTFKYLAEDSSLGSIGVLQKIISLFFAERNVLFLTGILLEAIWLWKNKKYYILSFVAFSFALLFYFQLWIAIPRKYYGLPFCIYGILGVCLLVEFLEKKRLNPTFITGTLFLVMMMGVGLIFTDNKYMLLKSKDSTVQTIFAKEMQSYGIDDFHMLFMGKLDNGFYQASGTLPNCPAFVTLNIIGDEFTNMQKQHVTEKKVEFIVTRDILCDSKDFDKYSNPDSNTTHSKVIGIDDFAYELIDEMSYYMEGSTYTMRLYKLSDNHAMR